MGKFKSTLFRDLSGSVGNVTSYVLDGEQVVRSKPFRVCDSKSLAQLKQRERMKLISGLRRRVAKVLTIGYCSGSAKVCSNRFVKDNVGKVQVDDELKAGVDLLELTLSGAGLALPVIGAEIDGATGRVVFHWKKQPFMPYMFKDDRLYGVVYETKSRKTRAIELGTRGVSGELAWELPKGWDAGKLVVYGFAVSADGKRASGTRGIVAS